MDEAILDGKALDIVRAAIEVCEINMSLSEGPEERKQVREQLGKLIEEARVIRKEGRTWRTWVLARLLPFFGHLI
jgi:hypothetical protein